jgi:maltooligosyltrehalose trehalohydrolase
VNEKGPSYRYGPLIEEAGTRFRLWAPDCDVALEIAGRPPVPMPSLGDGWRGCTADAPPGTRYRFRVGDIAVPDPASRMQSADIHDWSVVADPRFYRWRSVGWRGRPWEETILYELHPGLFGGFTGIARHLARLAALGITAIELMPVADFPGARSWGYDGVLPFAPDRAYGTPDELRALIDAAHAHGIMVFLDVVYNHFGPDGNYLGLYAREFFRADRDTPWGDAIDFRKAPVRRFFIENALYWVHEFRIDGLRFDAVHAIAGKDVLVELAAEVRASLPADRHVHLVLEDDDNDAGLIAEGFDAQWNDDLHHVLHVLLTGEHEGYYADYTDDPAGKLARALAEGFVYQGEASAYRGGERRGTRSDRLPPTAFVCFLQNHDQTGNRACGERLLALAPADALKAAAALLLLGPQIPMLFMGEEAGAMEPFLFFTDHREPALAHAVREGRRREFARFAQFADPAKRARIPDPNAFDTFSGSHPTLFGANADSWRNFYAELLRLRHTEIVPRLSGTRGEGARALGAACVLARWRMGDGAALTLACNLGRDPVAAELPSVAPVYGNPRAASIPAATTLCWIEPPRVDTHGAAP